MARRKKKAWNMTNPLYRFLHSKGKAKKTRKNRVRSVGMARYKFRRKGRSNGGGGIGRFVMKGVAGSKVPFGLLGLVAAGYAYARFASPSVPKVVPMQSALTESAVLGGLPAAVGAYLAGMTSGGNSVSGGVEY